MTIFKVRLNVNLNSTTLEQMESKMQSNLLSMIELLSDELKFARVPGLHLCISAPLHLWHLCASAPLRHVASASAPAHPRTPAEKLLAPLRYLRNKTLSRQPSDFDDVSEFRTTTEEALKVQQDIILRICDGGELARAITLEEEAREREQQSRKLSIEDVASDVLSDLRPERMRVACLEAARVAAGNGDQKNREAAVKLLKNSVKTGAKAREERARLKEEKRLRELREAGLPLPVERQASPTSMWEVENAVRRHKVAPEHAWKLDVLWVLLNKFDADPPWPSVIVEIMNEPASAGAAGFFAAFTQLLKDWVGIKMPRGDLAEGTHATVYVPHKGDERWTRARLTGKRKPCEKDPTVTLVEASLGSKQETLWVNKEKHVLFPRPEQRMLVGSTLPKPGEGILFEAVKACPSAARTPAKQIGSGSIPHVFTPVPAQSGRAELVQAVLDANVSVFSFDANANTALIMAAKNGRCDACRLLMQLGGDQHLYNKKRQNAFDAAVLGRHIQCLRIIQPTDVEKQLKQPETNQVTDLMRACHAGDRAKVEQLLGTSAADAETQPPTVTGKDGKAKTPAKLTALSFAADMGHIEIVDLLLEKKPAEAACFDALSRAAGRGHEEVVAKLLGHDSTLTRRADTESGMQAIHKAAQYGHDAVLRLLLEHRADAKAGNDFENTPLMLASRFGHASTAAILLERNADVNRGDKRKSTALMRAAGSGHSLVLMELLKCMSAEAQERLALDAQDQQGNTALMKACSSGQVGTATLLLDEGANAEVGRGSEDGDGMTALHIACKYGHFAVVKALLQLPDEVVKRLARATDKQHNTPLMLAAHFGFEITVRLLLNDRRSAATVSTPRESDGCARRLNPHPHPHHLLLYPHHLHPHHRRQQHPAVAIASRYTALMVAVEQAHEEVVHVILQQSKTDVHNAAKDGVTTALTLARAGGDAVSKKVLKLLHQTRSAPRPSPTPPLAPRPSLPALAVPAPSVRACSVAARQPCSSRATSRPRWPSRCGTAGCAGARPRASKCRCPRSTSVAWRCCR